MYHLEAKLTNIDECLEGTKLDPGSWETRIITAFQKLGH